jgi:RNA recognition motif-containing protein
LISLLNQSLNQLPVLFANFLFIIKIKKMAKLGASEIRVREKNRNRLFVSNLHPSTTEGDLLKIFSAYGKLSRIDYKWHKSGENSGKPKGFAFVDFESDLIAKRALNAGNDPNKIVVRGRRLTVKYSDVEEASSTDSSNPYAPTSASFEESSSNKKRGREDSAEGDLKKLKNIRMIEEKMKKLEETLKKMG